MAIFRGVGGSGDSSDNSFLQEVTAQANAASASASAASASAVLAQASANSILTLTAATGAAGTDVSYNASTGVLTVPRGADGTDASVTAANVTGVLTGGTGISIASNGTITNDLPDQTVALTGTGATTITGTYPNFTINSANTTYIVGDGGLTTNDFTDADHSKLNGIEANATADQTGAEIKSAYEAVADTNAYTDAEKTKLSGIEASADVTDTANVTSAGAAMLASSPTFTGTITAPNVDISTTGSVTTNIATGADNNNATDVKVVNIGTGYGGYFHGASTTINMGSQDALATNIFNIGNGSTAANGTTINLKGNVNVDGTITGWSPYYKSSEVRLGGAASYLYLNTSDQDLGQYTTIYHPTTPVETSRHVDVEWSTYWNYTSSVNDIRLTLQLTVPSGATTHTLGTVTEQSTSGPYSIRTSGEEWYYVSGDKTHLFTQFGRVSQVSTGGSVEHIIRASQYDPTTNRTYFCSTNSLSAMSTGDTAYWHPYAWESAGTTLTQSYDITERYRSGIDRNKVSFKLAFTDATLAFKLKIKEVASGDTAQVRDIIAKLTSVGL